MKKEIVQRRSIRNYEDTPLKERDVLMLEHLIHQTNTGSHLSFQLVVEGSTIFQDQKKTYGLFSNVHCFIYLKGPKNLEHLQEKCGYYGELLALEATKAGLGTCFVGGTYDKDACHINEEEQLICLLVVGYEAEKKQLKSKILSSFSNNRKPIEKRLTSDAPVEGFLKEGIEAVRLASSAINRQAPKFKYENGVLSAYVDSDGHFDLVDLGIAKANFIYEVGGTFIFGNPGIYHKN